MSRDIFTLDKRHKDEHAVFVLDATALRYQQEKDGITDKNQKKQTKNPPTIDVTFIGTRIEQFWEFTEPNGTKKLIWCKGTVVAVNNNNNKVRIKWEKEYYRSGDLEISEEALLKTKWNKQVE